MGSPEANRQGLSETKGDTYGMLVNAGMLGAIGVAAAAPVAITQLEALALRRLVADVSAEFAANPSAVASYLRPAEIAQSARFAAANYGKAMERAVAERVLNSPVLSKVLEYSSRPFVRTPDFTSRIGPGVYDITTAGTRWGASHFDRGYQGWLKIIGYVKP
jgi:hypothetical protein